MDTCRICLLPATEQVASLHTIYGRRTVAEMIWFCSGIEVILNFYQRRKKFFSYENILQKFQVSVNDSLPQIVCPACLPQIVNACKIKQTCINSDKVLRTHDKSEENEEFPLSVPEPAVKIESEPDIFHVDSSLVKDEPLDELEEICKIEFEYYKFTDPMMKSVREYSPEKRRYSPERRYKLKQSSSRTKKEPLASSFKCYLCNKMFYQRKLKHEHLDNVHSSDEFKCRVCKHKSQTARGMDNHMMIHENPELLSHMCHICSKNYQKACELRRHIKLSHSDKSLRLSKFFCDFCDFKTFSKMNVKRHLRTIHLKIKAFQCQFCPGKFGGAIERIQIVVH